MLYQELSHLNVIRTDFNKALRNLDEAVRILGPILRSHESLTEEERLFLENRLLTLQLDYELWAKHNRREEKAS